MSGTEYIKHVFEREQMVGDMRRAITGLKRRCQEIRRSPMNNKREQAIRWLVVEIPQVKERRDNLCEDIVRQKIRLQEIEADLIEAEIELSALAQSYDVLKGRASDD